MDWSCPSYPEDLFTESQSIIHAKPPLLRCGGLLCLKCALFTLGGFLTFWSARGESVRALTAPEVEGSGAERGDEPHASLFDGRLGCGQLEVEAARSEGGWGRTDAALQGSVCCAITSKQVGL